MLTQPYLFKFDFSQHCPYQIIINQTALLIIKSNNACALRVLTTMSGTILGYRRRVFTLRGGVSQEDLLDHGHWGIVFVPVSVPVVVRGKVGVVWTVAVWKVVGALTERNIKSRISLLISIIHYQHVRNIVKWRILMLLKPPPYTLIINLKLLAAYHVKHIRLGDNMLFTHQTKAANQTSWYLHWHFPQR